MKPMLFNTEMVRAILDGRKTVTRRVVKPQPRAECDHGGQHEFIRDGFTEGGSFTGFVCKKCGYGVCGPHFKFPVGTSWLRPPYHPGDILYVRETWCNANTEENPCYFYKADGDRPHDLDKLTPWRPSIHMPKEAARLFLRVKGVRVERLHDMTTADMVNEGMDAQEAIHSPWKWHELWDSTIKPADLALYGWAANPWVWVIEFQRITKEEAEHGSEQV